MLNFLTEPGLVMLVMIKEGDYGLLFIILMIYTNQNFTMYDPLCELSPSVVKCILTFLTMCALRHARLLRMAGDQPHTIDVYQDLGFDVKFKWSKVLILLRMWWIVNEDTHVDPVTPFIHLF